MPSTRPPEELPVTDPKPLPLAAVDGRPVPPLPPKEVFEGFVASNEKARRSTQMAFSNAVTTRALVEVLASNGLLDEETFTQLRERFAEEVGETFQSAELSSVMSTDTRDKYELDRADLPQIDCEARLPLCKAACCTMRWALSEQDIVEGVLHWELARPYANRIRESDGLCVHCDPLTKGCGVYEERPVVCRIYTCEHDPRVWLDFEQRVINPDLFDEDGNVRKPMKDSKMRDAVEEDR
jgi:hypothetical protein